MKFANRLLCCMLLLFLAVPEVPAGKDVRRTPVVSAVQKALPSVVNIGTEKLVQVRYADPSRRFRGDLFDEFFRDFFGGARPGYKMQNSLGSGVIVDPRGYILTNFHVIERASKIRVTLSDERGYDAVVLAGDEINDLALLKIEPEQPLSAASFAKDDDFMLGETVIVLGNPFGLAHTVTVGVLSATDREARYQGEVLYRDILQTDAAVNPGSSGGPLLNLDGELIGINVAIYREAQNIGFAVPVRRVRELAGAWLSPELTRRLSPGFGVESHGSELLVGKTGERTGVAAPASLLPGDRIVAVADRPVDSIFEYHRALLGYEEGASVPLTIVRESGTSVVQVALAALPKLSGAELGRDRLGLEFSAEPPTVRPGGAVLGQGLVVQSVVKDGVAAAAGLRPGMIVTQVNDTEIRTLDDVGHALRDARSGQKVVLGLLSVEESGTFILAQRSSVTLVAQ
ncbi:MAG: Periplasmic pH-dependent serine endoprotease DegQ precursor [Verrucomicrobia bacterium ADurb.Bin345]|nr:MAG: Periplasmic pH-dependent serine endoprotease DegQ precursor [Verrucomicrobia bacterium ADurb.Bin345]